MNHVDVKKNRVVTCTKCKKKKRNRTSTQRRILRAIIFAGMLRLSK